MGCRSFGSTGLLIYYNRRRRRSFITSHCNHTI
uniref:Uncharacterized protein n=1 Tax=Physcomitrium patens TaxID=3218 RepID=A0A2K1IUF7_PHYPA|nr:hypothetical protein PHYPA_024852 [Physcomitrium patens]